MTASRLQLYSFFVSSSAHTVRIALNLKGLDYEYNSVNLFKSEQDGPEYLRINPLGYVPALKDGDFVLADSFAIAMYLEEKYPQPTLLPHDLKKKALNYQVVNVITSSTQPLVRLPILGYIKQNRGRDEMISWAHEHYGKGFTALEILLKDHAGKYATGDEIFLADVFLEPIITASQSYKVDMSKYPLLSRLSKAYKQVPAFIDAMPENQPDYYPTRRGKSRI
ncbi:glutathione S-transferase zeta class-like [Rutidosis leptorrhynchoides]|uniref:glutathione S-transferase zeta class-like n=1 Tax=Rutidosis leptorrhynchoides TaxID=125765 RepID=UPI003A9970F6